MARQTQGRLGRRALGGEREDSSGNEGNLAESSTTYAIAGPGTEDSLDRHGCRCPLSDGG